MGSGLFFSMQPTRQNKETGSTYFAVHYSLIIDGALVFSKVRRVRPFVLLIKVLLRRCDNEIIPTGDNGSIQENT
jgi:hypothetical protein